MSDPKAALYPRVIDGFVLPARQYRCTFGVCAHVSAVWLRLSEDDALVYAACRECWDLVRALGLEGAVRVMRSTQRTPARRYDA